MQRIQYRTFDGIAPRLHPESLPENAAQTAKDVELRRGALTPVLGLAVATQTGYDCGAGQKTIYLWRYTDWTLTTATLGTTTAGTWAAVASAGKFKLTVDDVVYTVNPALTGCATMAAVATALQTAIRAQTAGTERVVYVAAAGAVGAHFVIYGNAVVSTIAAPDTGTNLAAAGFLNGAGTAATTAGEEWLSWTTDVNVVAGPINADPYSRLYFTGDGLPKMQLRMAGQTVTRTLKIEAPATPTTDGTPYEEIAGSAARDAFDITEARMRFWLNGALKYSQDVTFTQTGDTITVTNGSYTGTGTGTWHWQLEIKVNGVWEMHDQGTGDDSWHMVSYSEDGLYKLDIDFTTGAGWIWRSVLSSTGLYLSWGGATKLRYYNADGTEVAGEVEDDSVAVTYCATFVTDLGEEGPLSDATEVYLSNSTDPITLGPGGTLPLPVDATRGISTLRLYRAAAGVFRWMADVAITTSPYQYVDDQTTVDDALGEEANDDVDNPPDDMEGLVACVGGWFAAFRGREVLASQSYIPNAWPLSYQLTVQHDIVALAAVGTDLFVMTKGRPVMLSGTLPDELSQSNIESDQACVSAAGVVLLGKTVLYPSPDGLVSMYAGQVSVVTAEYYRREDWQALVPETIRAAGHDGRYYASLGGNGMLIVDFSETADRVTTSDEDVDGLYSDPLTDALYAIQESEIRKWRGSADVLPFDWKGRDWVYVNPVAFAVLRVMAAAYVVPGEGETDTRPLVTLYANGTSVHEQRVASIGAVRLPMLVPARRWSVRVQSMVEVTEAAVATSMKALRS